MRLRYENRRTLVTLSGTQRLRLKIRRCEAEGCARFRKPYRPEAEGALALPQHEFGLDVMALVGALRHREHRSVPEIHAILRDRGVPIAERSVTNLLDRYDEVVSTRLGDPQHLRRQLGGQDRIVLALDGLQPDVGHEVLWVLRDCLSGTVLLARSLLSGTAEDLTVLLREVVEAVGVPVAGVISDGQHSIRKAVATALPEVPHQLCHFHFLREAALPIFEADRHAKKELKKAVRGVRPIERAVEGRSDAEANVVRGYASAVRSAITDDGRAPLDAAGLRLKDRLEKVAGSLERVRSKGGPSRPLARLALLIGRALARTAALWPVVRQGFVFVHAAARLLADPAGETGAKVRRRFDGLLAAMQRHRRRVVDLGAALDHFRKVARSYRPGLFYAPDVAGLPRTNNALEQLFGSQRYHERRATGRKTASPGAVLRGSVRLVAGIGTRARILSGRDLGRVDRARWQDLRRSLDDRRQARVARTRFRRDPDAYLTALERQAQQLDLPA
ncbi:ISNCY family transposase [Methylobacterium sp. Leaf111]|uniref:ISNCY family transposase n=1 Tax=Methylobacterium sp. Leaf111 TaxID=1736257 RepID=UPI0012E8C2F1|nr:ISNCY family transposase [Methylobacterium sp. Leaf111]